jgi:hypothetical protein
MTISTTKTLNLSFPLPSGAIVRPWNAISGQSAKYFQLQQSACENVQIKEGKRKQPAIVH